MHQRERLDPAEVLFRHDLHVDDVTIILSVGDQGGPATIIQADGLGIARPETGLPQGQSRRHHAAVLPSANQGWMVDGYNCFWMAEHHFQREGSECIPNTILMAMASMSVAMDSALLSAVARWAFE